MNRYDLQMLVAIAAFCALMALVTGCFYILAGRKIARTNRSLAMASTRWFSSVIIVTTGLIWIYTGSGPHREMGVALILLAALFTYPLAAAVTKKLFQNHR